MKITTTITLLIITIGFMFIACANDSDSKGLSKSNAKVPLKDSSMVDERDGEKYAIVKIGEQVWMAENLRFVCEGSLFNNKNPSKNYGRYYKVPALMNICPKGWHLPTDKEWDQLEIAHKMPASFVGKSGWRGAHAANLKSKEGWDETPDEQMQEGWTKIGNGVDLMGFTVLPAGYYFPEDLGEAGGMQGERNAAGFWSAPETVMKDNQIVEQVFARFMFGSRTFVNKWADINGDSEAALSCRCVRD